MSLDWQELPGDTLNLTTQRSYKVPEVRDLINQHLLARGFTLLCHGETMSVADIKKLDPSLVPRVEPDELAKRDPHEFVKVSFPLDLFAAGEAVNELKPMLSPNGKLNAMNETSRLEAMDAVNNLRDIDAVLRQQQARANRPRTLREFKLKYVRADYVHELLSTLLGIQTPKMPGMPGQPGMDPQQQMMMAQAQARGMQPGQPQPNGVPAAAKDTAITLAVNLRNNSILAQAPAEKMAIIAQAIDAIDIPSDREGLSPTNLGRMQVYRLTGIDPEPVVKTLTELGNLDPTTRLQVDKKNSAIIAYASLVDHVTIRALVDKLTGSDRTFAVIRLHRLPADYVAGTIDFMFGSGGKKDKTRQSPYYYSPYGQPSQQEEASKKEFRVEADVEHNRLLLLANSVELTEIEALLIKLGEIPAAGSGSATVRVIDGGDDKERQELIERIRKVWPSLSPNALSAPGAADPAAAKENDNDPKHQRGTEGLQGEQKQQGPESGPSRGHQVGVPADNPGRAQYRYTAAPGELAQGTSANGGRDATGLLPPPVKITISPDGKLLVSSQDIEALDLLESLAAELPASRKDYRIFQLKYALASSVALNLEEYFKEKKDEQSGMRYIIYDYGMGPQNDTEDDRRLSKRRKLKFISDVDTNTILVEGADAKQLKTIDELVQLYDQPPPTDSQSVRKTELIHLKCAKAKVVAETVKDVYRDLLSANDKALNDRNNQRGGTNYTINYGSSDTDSAGQKTPRFKGLLSIGVDETSNSLVVSAPAFLFDHVSKMIRDLDVAAAPDYEVQVMRIGPGITPERVKEILDEVYNHKAAENPPAENVPAGKRPSRKSSTSSKSGGRSGSPSQEGSSSGDKENK